MSVAVCAIVRDEAPYVLEWVAWQRLAGFGRVVVYDNDSVDGTGAILAALDRAGAVEHVPWPDRPGVAAQFSAYEDALVRLRDAAWVAFLDADEFLALYDHPGVGAFLHRFPPDVSAVAVTQAIFGSAGQDAPDGRLVTERFTRRGPDGFFGNHWVKSIVRPAAVARPGIHMCTLRAGTYADPSGRVVAPLAPDRFPIHPGTARCNHYILKSRAEYARKADRAGLASDPPGIVPARARYSDAFFAAHDVNDVEDGWAARRALELHGKITRLRDRASL